jgi:hypothetical protein
MTKISIEPFAQAHLDGLIALVAAEGRLHPTPVTSREQHGRDHARRCHCINTQHDGMG